MIFGDFWNVCGFHVFNQPNLKWNFDSVYLEQKMLDTTKPAFHNNYEWVFKINIFTEGKSQCVIVHTRFFLESIIQLNSNECINLLSFKNKLLKIIHFARKECEFHLLLFCVSECSKIQSECRFKSRLSFNYANKCIILMKSDNVSDSWIAWVSILKRFVDRESNNCSMKKITK